MNGSSRIRQRHLRRQVQLAFPADVFPRTVLASVWGLASMGSGFGGMLFMALSGWLIARFGYTPVFVGYGIAPVVALALVLFGIGPLRVDPRFAVAAASRSETPSS